MAPSNCPHLILQAMAGPLAAATASTVTNPMDVVRARVQVPTSYCTSIRQTQMRGFFCYNTEKLNPDVDILPSSKLIKITQYIR